MICENCGKEHDGSYGSGRFCSRSCANSRHHSEETKEKIKKSVYKSMEQRGIKRKEKKEKRKIKESIKKVCPTCNKVFFTKRNDQIYCSNECAIISKHNENYKDFLTNNEQYCRSNYNPVQRFYREFLMEQNNKCSICGSSPIHNNKELKFVCDHIDGDASNNKRDNLRLICPNCDSQLDTFKSKNKNSARQFRHKY